MENQFNHMIGQMLHKQRTRLRLTQEQMAQLSGMSCRQYQDLESGRRQPTFRTIVNISMNTGLNLTEMVQKLTQAGYQPEPDKRRGKPRLSSRRQTEQQDGKE